MKLKKILLICFVILCIPLTCFAVNEEDYEELDYVWLEEEINKAKEEEKPNINSRYAVVFDRASKTVIWEKESQKEVPMASTTKIMTS